MSHRVCSGLALCAALAAAPAFAAVPHFDHVVVVIMENHSAADIYGVNFADQVGSASSLATSAEKSRRGCPWSVAGDPSRPH